MKDRQLAGDVAIDVTRQLTDPVRTLRDRLGLLVDHLERHVATATGPTPYPWRSLQALRHDLGAAYLEATTLSRRLEELQRALEPQPLATFDLAAVADLGLRIGGHHLGPDIELFVDLGNATPARGIAGQLALLIAQIVGVCARSARALGGSSLSLRVWTDADGTSVVTIADNGGGDPNIDAIRDLARAIIEPWGATIDAASTPGQGCAFELRFPV